MQLALALHRKLRLSAAFFSHATLSEDCHAHRSRCLCNRCHGQQAGRYGYWSRRPQDIGMLIEVNAHATSATTIPSELLGHTMSCQLEIHLAWGARAASTKLMYMLSKTVRHGCNLFLLLAMLYISVYIYIILITSERLHKRREFPCKHKYLNEILSSLDCTSDGPNTWTGQSVSLPNEGAKLVYHNSVGGHLMVSIYIYIYVYIYIYIYMAAAILYPCNDF